MCLYRLKHRSVLRSHDSFVQLTQGQYNARDVPRHCTHGALNIAVHRVSRSQSPIKQHPVRRLHSHVIANQESRKRMECLLWWHHVWQSNSASAAYRMPTGRSSSSETACVRQGANQEHVPLARLRSLTAMLK
jgi:hypothetical protein